MVMLPPPPKGKTSVSKNEIPSYRRTVFNRDGSVYSDKFLSGISHAEEWSLRTGLSSNKPRLIGTNQWWRGCSTYNRAVGICRYLEGVCTSHYLDGSGTADRFEGQAWPSYQSFEGPLIDFSTWLPKAMTANMRNRLNTELLLKVGARKASYGESLGEMRQTANHLAGTVSSLVKGVLAARKGNWGKAAYEWGVSPKSLKGTKGWASKWLSYQYAWQPLMGEVYDTYGLLTNGFREKKLIASSVRVLRDTHTASDKDIRSGYTSKVWGNSQVQYRAKVYYSISDSSLSRFHQLGLINPLEVAWALTPYSFVVDWFVPVGNVLEALTATFGVDFIDGFYSQKASAAYTTQPHVNPTFGAKVSANTIQSRTEITSYSRQRMTGFPLPGLYVKSPFSTTHVTSALALVRQLIR